MGTSAGDIWLQRLVATSGGDDWLVVAVKGSKSKSFSSMASMVLFYPSLRSNSILINCFI